MSGTLAAKHPSFVKTNFARKSLLVLALAAVIPLSYLGVRDLLYSRPLEPLFEGLNKEFPVFPGTTLVEAGKTGVSIGPYNSASLRTRYSVQLTKRIVIGIPGTRPPSASTVIEFYRSHLQSCGLRWGSRSGLPGVNEHILESGDGHWVAQKTPEPIQQISHVLLSSSEGCCTIDCRFYKVHERSMALVHIWIFECGFTDSAGLWPAR